MVGPFPGSSEVIVGPSYEKIPEGVAFDGWPRISTLT